MLLSAIFDVPGRSCRRNLSSQFLCLVLYNIKCLDASINHSHSNWNRKNVSEGIEAPTAEQWRLPEAIWIFEENPQRLGIGKKRQRRRRPRAKHQYIAQCVYSIWLFLSQSNRKLRKKSITNLVHFYIGRCCLMSVVFRKSKLFITSFSYSFSITTWSICNDD